MTKQKILETRAAVENDESYIWHLYSEAARPLVEPHMSTDWDDGKEKARFLKELNIEACHILLLDGEPVGWAAGIDSPGQFKLEHLYIDPEERGKGIGGTFFKEYSAKLQKEGVTLAVEIMKGTRARVFVERNGFVSCADNGLTETFKMT